MTNEDSREPYMKCECLKAALLFKGLCCTGTVSAEPGPIFTHKMITGT